MRLRRGEMRRNRECTINMYRQDQYPTFEEVYPKAEFSELIRLTLAFAEVLKRLRARLSPSRPTCSGDDMASPA